MRVADLDFQTRSLQGGLWETCKSSPRPPLISTGMNGRNLGPVSTTNGLTEQVFDLGPTFLNNPTNGLTEPGFVVILKQKRKISSNLLTNFVELLKINIINLIDRIYT
jgi:hypothetical protein